MGWKQSETTMACIETVKQTFTPFAYGSNNSVECIVKRDTTDFR